MKAIIDYILSFQPYVMLPIIIFFLSIIFHIGIQDAIKSSLTIGIGFIGIFIVFDFFISKIGPVLEQLIARTGLEYNVLDVGWPPMATIAWGFKLAPILLIILIGVNVILLLLNFTDTANIDIWNYWHFIFMGTLVYHVTGNIILTILSAVIANIVTIKLADYSARDVQKLINMKGISIPTLSGAIYYPIAKVLDRIIDKIPKLNKIEANPEHIQKKLGMLGEPIIIGFVLGVTLGGVSGYGIKNILELGFSIAAVVHILPIMSGVLTKGLLPISEGMQSFLHKKAPHLKNKHIGLDSAVIIGHPSVVVTGLLLMPLSLLLAFLIPGVNFIPLGDLPNTIGFAGMVVVACKGNIIRSLIVSIPILSAKLLAASNLTSVYTELALRTQMELGGYQGQITGFLDGGNVFRFWLLRIFEGKLWALGCLPIVVGIFLYSRYTSLKQNV